MKTTNLFLCSLILGACTTGNSYPAQYANAYCSSLYKCVDADSVEFIYNYDDVAECKEKEEENIRSSSTFDSFEEGDLEFNSEAAEECLSEMTEVQSDSDCTGNMDIISFFADSISNQCSKVYE